MAARSTTAGTPVKSCISTRAGRKAISRSEAPRLQPARHGLDVVDRDRAAVLVAQQVFEQHLQRERQARDVAEPVLLRGLEAEIVETTRADLERPARLETVQGGHGGDLLEAFFGAADDITTLSFFASGKITISPFSRRIAATAQHHPLASNQAETPTRLPGRPLQNSKAGDRKDSYRDPQRLSLSTSSAALPLSSQRGAAQ